MTPIEDRNRGAIHRLRSWQPARGNFGPSELGSTDLQVATAGGTWAGMVPLKRRAMRHPVRQAALLICFGQSSRLAPRTGGLF